jgi:Ca2+-binding RTX toxin-like protein
MNHVHHHRIRILAGAAILAIGMLTGIAPAHAAVDCVASFGVTQTPTTVTGTSANDIIDCGGANPGKTVNGNGGNDTITGTVFVDNLLGNDGNDTMTGGIGDDVLTGGNGNDTMTGSAGNDVLNGGVGDDTITGSEGDDIINGETNDDTLNGGVGEDTLSGGDGTDLINGDAGNDSLTGPPLDGRIDTLNGGAGTDSCQAPVLLDLLWRDVLIDCNP